MQSTPAEATWGYRPALDGLRAVAVLLVIGFHAGMARLVNGFVGVDVFFVLSGYLVTSVVVAADLDQFRFADFYGRRVRRLLPAAALIVVVASVMTWLFEPTFVRADLVGDAQAALLYVANWRFIADGNAYFGDQIESSPFVQFWSLAIEEQFYLLYPLALVGGYRLLRRRRAASSALAVVGVAVGVAAAMSLGLQVWWAGRDELRSYYGTDARLYQLLVGAAVAIAVARRRGDLAGWVADHGRVVRVVAPVALGATVVLATPWLGLSVSARGMAVTVTALAVVAALDLERGGPMAAALAWRPLVYVGQISYGVYLIHWPLTLLLGSAISVAPVVLAALVTAGSLFAATISYRLIEQPIRRSTALARIPVRTALGGLAVSVFLAVAVVGPVLRADREPMEWATAARVDEQREAIDPTALDADADAALAAANAEAVDADWDFAAIAEGVPGNDCRSGDCVLVPGDFSVHLMGDSNASMLRSMFTALAEERGWQLAETSFQSCPWQDGLVAAGTLADCGDLRARWYDVVGETQPDVVVVSSLTDIAPDLRFEDLTGDAAWDAATDAAITELTATGAWLVLVEPVRYDRSVDTLECLARSSVVGDCAYQQPPEHPVAERYRELAATHDRVVSISLDPYVCPAAPICIPVQGGIPVFQNDTHISRAFGAAIRDLVADEMTAAGVPLN